MNTRSQVVAAYRTLAATAENMARFYRQQADAVEQLPEHVLATTLPGHVQFLDDQSADSVRAVRRVGAVC